MPPPTARDPFQGRYKAQVIEADAYARWLVEYIHLNPVRPRQRSGPIASERQKELRTYRWSSHLDYGGWRRSKEGWLCLDWLAYWGRNRREAQRAYRAAMQHWFGRKITSPWDQLRGALVLGGEDLYQKVRALAGQKDGLEAARWTRSEEAGRCVNECENWWPMRKTIG